MKPKHLLFLDIDGVLRPLSAYNGKLSAASINSVKRIAKHFDSKIVITSTWRDIHPWKTFNAPNIFDGLVVGQTPDLDPFHTECGRYSEVLAYLKQCNCIDVPWLAIDDKQYHYPVGHRNVFLTNPETGLTANDVELIIGAQRKPTSSDTQPGLSFSPEIDAKIRKVMTREGLDYNQAVEWLVKLGLSIL